MGAQRTVTIPEVMRMRILYEIEGMSLRQVVAVTGRSQSTVAWHLKRAGVELRQPYMSALGKRRLSYEQEVQTVDLYASGLSMGQVADALGVSRNAVCYRLAQAGAGSRTRAEGRVLRAAHGRVGRAVDDVLVRLYRDERLSLAQVAERCGVERGTVRRALLRRGLAVRSLSDAARVDKARRAGRDVMAVPIDEVVEPSGEVLDRTEGRGTRLERRSVSSAPLAAAVRAQALRLSEDFTVGERIIAERAGLSPKVLYNWRTGKSPRALWDSADRVLVAIDREWWEVFDVAPGLFSGERGRDVVGWTKAALDAAELWGDA